jgi:VCBS repeat-containing protein
LAINAATGAVTLRAPANAESKSTYSFTIVVTDAGGLTSERSVTLAVANVNEAPLAAADSASATERGGVANGTGGSDAAGNALTNDSDPDNPDSASVTAVAFGGSAGTVGQLLQGSHGTLTLNADGSFSYAIDDTDAAVQALNVGDTLTESFSYTMTDAGGLSSSSTITITLHGANDAPVAPAVPTATVTEGVPMSPIVVPPFTDVDNNVLTCTATLPGGGPLPGWLSFNPVSRTFTGTPPSGSAGTITIRVTGTDGSLADHADILLEIANPPPPPPPVQPPSVAPIPPLMPPPTAVVIAPPADPEPRAPEPLPITRSTTTVPPVNEVLTPARPAFELTGSPLVTPYELARQQPVADAAPLGDLTTDSRGFRVVVIPSNVQALSVFRGIGDQFVERGSNVKFNLPADAFVHSRPDQIVRLVARQADGRPLPAWLQFDADNGSFSGSPPADFRGELRISIVARDGTGNEAAALFRLNVEEQRASDARSDTLSSRLREAQPFPPPAAALPELPAGDAADAANTAPAADVPPVEAGQGG